LKNNKINNSTILITGGAGFIGSYLTEELLKYSPAKIIIIDNLIRGSFENMKEFINSPVVEFIEGDIKNESLLEKYMPQCDYIFHMAALRINACAADPSDGFETMVRAPFIIAELARKHKIKKIIYSSSASVYGLAQNFPTTENDNPYDNQTFYGAAKLFGEQLFRSYKFMYGLDYVALRYFNVYGPRMDTDGKYTEVMIKWLDSIRDSKAPVIHGDGSTSMDFVFVKDVAEANVAALLSDVTDENFNIGNSRETSLKELLEMMIKINNSKIKPTFMESNTVNPVSRRLSDSNKARKLLNYFPKTKLEEGLKELSEWYFEKTKLVN
jgi:UDP-glucose 4-epimerase